jgi:hypothetical protein
MTLRAHGAAEVPRGVAVRITAEISEAAFEIAMDAAPVMLLVSWRHSARQRGDAI